MRYLVAVILIWAFAYNLSSNIAAVVDSDFVALARVMIAALVFLPFAKFTGFKKEFIFGLLAIGFIEIGVMYFFYYRVWGAISVPEALLFFASMPIFVTIFDDIFKKQIRPISFLAAIIAILAAVSIRWNDISNEFLIGLVLTQMTNAAYAFGMIWYKYHIIKHDNQHVPDHQMFFYVLLGGLVMALLSFVLFGDATRLPSETGQWGMIAYLAIVTTGLSFFLLNKGAKMVSGATVGVMNNMAIPVGMLVTFLFFDSAGIDPVAATVVLGVMGVALLINERYRHKIVFDFNNTQEAQQ